MREIWGIHNSASSHIPDLWFLRSLSFHVALVFRLSLFVCLHRLKLQWKHSCVWQQPEWNVLFLDSFIARLYRPSLYKKENIPMNMIVNRTLQLNSKWLSSKVLSCLFALAVLLHVGAQAIAQEHPLLAMLLTLLEAFCWISIFLMGIAWVCRAIKHGFPKVWNILRTWIPLRSTKKLVLLSNSFNSSVRMSSAYGLRCMG